MSKIVANLNGGASDEYATFKALNDAFSGQVFKGLDVVPNGSANMTVRVNPGSGRIPTGTAPADYYYMISHDTTAGESVTIATASASPRIDYVVAYVDKSVTAVQSPVNNTNNVLKFVAVAGTPASSPVVPTTAQIQSAIGAANPYIILAQVAVAASTTQITAPNITDVRLFTVARAGVAFGAYQSTGQANLASSTWTKVLLQTTEFDQSGGFSTTNSRFVARQAGLYQINGSVALNNGSGATLAMCAIYKNGAEWKRGNQTPMNSGQMDTTVGVLIDLAAGDYVELWAFATAAMTVLLGQNQTYINGFLTGAKA